jgi:putative transposase
MTPLSFKRHRFPPTIIRHCVWLYARFTLSYRDVEEMLSERGVDVSYEKDPCFCIAGPSVDRSERLEKLRTQIAGNHPAALEAI